MCIRRLLTCFVGLVALLSLAASAQESFADVDPDAYYADSVAWMISEGLTTGTADGLFRPEDPITRGETAVFLWRLAGEPPAPVHPFGDVTVGWQDAAIAWMYDADITQGITPTRFDPGGAVSRGSMATFMWRLAGEPLAPAHGFADVSDPDIQVPVSWVSATGLSTGLEPGVFAPDVPVVRGQMAAFLERLSELLSDSLVDEPVTPVTEGSTPTASPSSGVLLFASPSSPRVGERLEISGSGFDGDIRITIDGQVVDETTVLPNGTFESDITVPEGAEGMSPVVASRDGIEIAAVIVDVRPRAPAIGWWFPLLVIAAASAAVYIWWTRQEDQSSVPSLVVAELKTDEKPVAEAVPEPTVQVAEERCGAVEVSPLGLDTVGPIATLATYRGRTWGTTQSDHDGVSHVLIVTSDRGGSEWQEAADLGPGNIDAITVSGSDAIAVGARHIPEGAGLLRRPSLWHTNDLRSWLSVDLPASDFEDAVFDGVTAVGETLLLHGRSAHGPRVWTGSPDGWQTRVMPGPTDCVAVTERGVYVFGRDLDRRAPVLLMSGLEDVDFAPVKHASVAVFDAATILSVVDYQDGLVAGGFDNLNGTAAVFVSDDGASWHRSPSEFSDGTGIEAIIVFDDLLLAIGSSRGASHASRAPDLALWSSRDAVTWVPVDSGSVGSASRAVASTALEGGVIISGLRVMGAAGVEVPATWWLQPFDLLEDVATG